MLKTPPKPHKERNRPLSFVRRELERLDRALQNTPEGRYAELYAAQQTLAWALEPQAFKSPAVMIMGTQEDSADCPAYPGLHPSSDICALAA